MSQPNDLPPTNPLAELRLRRPPFWMIALFLILVVVSWIPLVVAARRRVSTAENPPIHIFQDMDNQPKLKAQQQNPIFADTRSERPQVAGTVSRGGLADDDHYYRGYALKSPPAEGKPAEVEFFQGFPQQVSVTETFIRRGQQQYNVYCAPCHGIDGYGQGPINQRALELQAALTPGMAWTQAASLHEDTIRTRPEGHLYNTITNGIRNMAGYGGQIQVSDRWAVVAYVRALQVSQNQKPEAVPADQVPALK